MFHIGVTGEKSHGLKAWLTATITAATAVASLACPSLLRLGVGDFCGTGGVVVKDLVGGVSVCNFVQFFS